MGEPSYTLITSRGAFFDALRQAFRNLPSQGGRQVFLSDLHFADWPLSEQEVVDALTQWAQPYRSLTLLASHYDDMARHHARWVAWRQRWTHVVSCRAADSEQVGDVPTQLLIPGQQVIRLVDRPSYRGSVSTAETDLVQAQEALDAVLQRSSDAFPATTLGL
ncbi:MAG: hypothetical protein V4739_03435 [Pseudomonadota bacterium]